MSRYLNFFFRLLLLIWGTLQFGFGLRPHDLLLALAMVVFAISSYFPAAKDHTLPTWERALNLLLNLLLLICGIMLCAGYAMGSYRF